MYVCMSMRHVHAYAASFAREVFAREVFAREVFAREVFAREVFAREVFAFAHLDISVYTCVNLSMYASVLCGYALYACVRLMYTDTYALYACVRLMYIDTYTLYACVRVKLSASARQHRT
jgi:hypothetical protein